jgi:hypothetical protein
MLRDRIGDGVGPDEKPTFNYPDIHADPAETYHDRFGVEQEHDRFLFPWLMNLIFEDRWLLAEDDPDEAIRNALRRRMKIDIRDPEPDAANFPNSPYTLPKGRLYIENSPLGLYGRSPNRLQRGIYQWEFLLRYGLTDNCELRLFSNGLTAETGRLRRPATSGFSPLAFDFKMNLWEENTRYHLPAMGFEAYLQTTFGSPAFDGGTQPSLNVLFDQTLPFDVGFEYNVGISGVQNRFGRIAYEPTVQWAFQRKVVDDFAVFFHGFLNEAALPRLIQFRQTELGAIFPRLHHLEQKAAGIPTILVMGIGGIWTINDRLAVFGSYNLGVTPSSPRTIALAGFAVAF